MIGFFPNPYPDELFYSICARYSGRVKFPNKKTAAKNFFGSKNNSAIVDFPSHLDRFISVLPPGHGFTSDEIINKNTLLPFFQPFIPVDRLKIIKKEMKSASGLRLQSRMGLKVKQLRPITYLCYCSACVIEDIKEYGETYWHRIPQLAGICVCPDHGCFFSDSEIESGRQSAAFFIPANSTIKITKPIYLDSASKNHRQLLKMAKDAKWLLSQDAIIPGTDLVRFRYYNALLKKGFAYYNGRIKVSEFQKAFDKCFSSDIFDSIGRISGRSDWIVKVLLSSNTGITYHPVRHLLLMTFLEKSAEGFFLKFEEYKPFGDPPYPCLNAASEHFGQYPIEKCEVLDNQTKGEKSRGLPLGVFRCDCGFIYRRLGPDQNNEDRFKFNSIREYGSIWENKLSEYWQNPAISIAGIAVRLKTSLSKIVRHAIRLGLSEMFPEARQIQGYKRYRNPRRYFLGMLTDYRNQWLEILKNNPQATRQQLLNKANFLYLWLRRNDSEWFEEHLPPVNKSLRKIEFLDWNKIDNELQARVRKVMTDIKAETDPIKRFSITEIIGRIGKKKWLDKRESKLPLTAALIEENLETLEDFMMRKVHHMKNLYLKEKTLPTRLQFQVRARLRNKTSAESKQVQKKIDEALRFLYNNQFL